MTVVNSFQWSPNFYAGRRGCSILWIVLHDMEAPEGRTTAENVAAFLCRPTTKASAHYCVDQDSIVQLVHRGDRAWHACATGNLYGIGIEQAGYARFTREQWLESDSRATIHNAARIAAEDAFDLGIPARTLTDDEVRSKKVKGVVTHQQLSRVFKESDHQDPSARYPMDVFLADMQAELDRLAGTSKAAAVAKVATATSTANAASTVVITSTPTAPKDWFDVATKEDLKDAIREVLNEPLLDDDDAQGKISPLRALYRAYSQSRSARILAGRLAAKQGVNAHILDFVSSESPDQLRP